MTIKAVIFDIGSVVINRFTKKQEKAIKKKFGIYSTKGDDAHKIRLLASTGKGSLRHVFKESIKTQNKNIQLEEFIEFYKEQYEISSPIKKSMIKLIKRLRTNYGVYAFSNTHDIHEIVNKKRGLFKNFDGVFLSNRIGYRKPDKNAYIHVLKKLKIKPSEAIFIDDKPKNVEVAASLGIKGTTFSNYGQLIKNLRKLGVKI